VGTNLDGIGYRNYWELTDTYRPNGQLETIQRFTGLDGSGGVALTSYHTPTMMAGA